MPVTMQVRAARRDTCAHLSDLTPCLSPVVRSVQGSPSQRSPTQRAPPQYVSPQFSAKPMISQRVHSSPSTAQMSFDPSRGGWVAPTSTRFSQQPSSTNDTARSAQWTPGQPGDGNMNLKGSAAYPPTAKPTYAEEVASGQYKSGKYERGVSQMPWAPPPMEHMFQYATSPVAPPRYKPTYARDCNVPLRGGWPIQRSVE